MKREFLQDLGLDSEVIGKVMAEYGKNVNAMKDKVEKYDVLKEQHDSQQEKHKNDMSEVNKRLEAATKGAGDYETLNNAFEKFKLENETMVKENETQLLKLKKNSIVDVALLKAGFIEAYIPMVKAQLNLDNLTLDGDDLIGLTDVVNGSKEKFKELVGQEQNKGSDPYLNRQDSKEKNPWSKENYNLTEQGRIYREDPEKARHMMSNV